jgi:SAM-dependent methyltransferase
MVDLGVSPLCQTVVRAEQLSAMEPFYPLHVRVCTVCWLAQLPELVSSEELFVEYAYFSAYADSWVDHARRYVDMITDRLALGRDDLVIELASNDGYLLQHFIPKGIPVLGVDPARNVAEAAAARGVPTLTEFFGLELATRLVAEGRSAGLVLGNNVLAQIPDLNDFVAGVKVLVAPGGTATFEVPHLARLIASLAYDTIYHEHFSYFSLHSLHALFAASGLELVDVEELPTHGGSLRVFLRHVEEGVTPSPHVARVLAEEESAGLRDPATYARFADGVAESKRALLELLIALNREGRQVVGYGAPGKGNTLLNYCGIRTDLVRYTVDRNPYKQNAFTPGTRIPIYPPERIAETRPDAILVLPWNLAGEIGPQLAYTAEWGATLITAIPTARCFPPGVPLTTIGDRDAGPSRLDTALGAEAARAAVEAVPGPRATTEGPGIVGS